MLSSVVFCLLCLKLLLTVCWILQGKDTKSSPPKKETKGKSAAGKTEAAAKGGKRKAKA